MRCDHLPQLGSCRTLQGTPADLLNSRDYPITAVCVFCGAPIRSEQFLIRRDEPVWKVTVTVR